MNKQLLIGNLGREPELKNVGDTQLCKLSVATVESVKKQGEWTKETTWHDVVCWGKTAEACCRYLGKGSKVYIEGRTQKRKWESDQGTKYFTEVVADKVEFLDSKKDRESASTQAMPRTVDSATLMATVQANHAALGGEPLRGFDDDDIPF